MRIQEAGKEGLGSMACVVCPRTSGWHFKTESTAENILAWSNACLYHMTLLSRLGNLESTGFLDSISHNLLLSCVDLMRVEI